MFDLESELDRTIFKKNKISTPISRDHSNGYNRKFKALDNKKNKFNNHKILRFEAYKLYREKELPNDTHINYISFAKVLIYLFTEIAKQVILNKKAWNINRIGIIRFSSIYVKKNENIIINNSPETGKAKMDMVKVFGKIKYYKSSNLYLRRFSFLVSKKIKLMFQKDLREYSKSYTHKRFTELKTYI